MPRPSKKINIYSIAEEAGVSVPTVSRVINRKAGIAEATRERVNRVLSRHNFTPEPSVTRTTKIAVIYPGLVLSGYFHKTMSGIYAYALENDLLVNTIIYGPHLKKSLLGTIRDQQCSGVVALIPDSYRKELDSLGGTDLPVMVVDSTTEDQNIGFVDNDSTSGSFLATKHLLELGHRKIGYLTYDSPSLNQLQRFKSFENTLKMHNVILDPNWVIGQAVDESDPVRGAVGYSAMKILLQQAPKITAVMAVDDSMALGAIAAIYEAGLRAPDDISVVGFDNYPETAYWNPPLTTVDHPLEEAGRFAIKSVHEGLSNPGKWIPPKNILSTNLVIRKSTGPVRD